ncbi:MAG TPA: toll/interleukin-1 receptor domain-containing protein [Dehalococcoidia bacterium]|nr:toll/interleukin-1 receptor domain-containing protein [Dehalococcoidia bacterium]
MAVPAIPYLVFISHSSRDTWVAKQLAKEISDCGASPFLDVLDIKAGADFEDRIRESLSRASELVVLLTPAALESRYVWVELGGAWILELPIIALLYGPTPSEIQSMQSMPILKATNLIELNDFETYLSQLAARVSSGRGA